MLSVLAGNAVAFAYVSEKPVSEKPHPMLYAELLEPRDVVGVLRLRAPSRRGQPLRGGKVGG